MAFAFMFLIYQICFSSLFYFCYFKFTKSTAGFLPLLAYSFYTAMMKRQKPITFWISKEKNVKTKLKIKQLISLLRKIDFIAISVYLSGKLHTHTHTKNKYARNFTNCLNLCLFVCLCLCVSVCACLTSSLLLTFPRLTLTFGLFHIDFCKFVLF